MAMTSDLATLEARADAHAAGRQFAEARALLEQLVAAHPSHFPAWLKLASMQIALQDFQLALASVESALAQRPLDFSCLMMRANLLDQLGRKKMAGEAFGRALHNAPPILPDHAKPALARAQERYAAWQQAERHRLTSAVVAVTEVTPRLQDMIDASLRLIPPGREGPAHFCYPGLDETAFFDRTDLDWVAALEAETEVILAEFTRLMESRNAQLMPYIQYPENVPLEQWKALNHNDDWRAAHLMLNGERFDDNLSHCPQTEKLLSILPQPQIAGAGPNAMFSLLAPGAHIPPHTGINNARLVCHLPLIVPEGCWFRVGDETRHWQKGEMLIFDDTVEHEALNPSDQLRVVLIFDIWHPALSAAERAGITALIEADGRMHGL
jgi:tetratricopeptide (TPR) repeat protein